MSNYIRQSSDKWKTMCKNHKCIHSNSRATHNIKQRQVKKGTSWYIIVDQVIIFCKLECMPHYTDNKEAKIIGRNNKRNCSTSIQICIYEKIITYLINIEWGISIKKNNEWTTYDYHADQLLSKEDTQSYFIMLLTLNNNLISMGNNSHIKSNNWKYT